ncbi:MAG: hypothetical protein CM1200mP35_03070 [Chloroflexota bacterium]|nr:MAG: hypothetical protein CM1200mP35_03070 [Chloroflexota bacterium]
MYSLQERFSSSYKRGKNRVTATNCRLEPVDEQDIPKLDRVFKFKNFVDALAFTNVIGDLAEEQGHHPKLITEWGRVQVTWWTHKIRNLHRNDFVMAAKTDQIYSDIEQTF